MRTLFVVLVTLFLSLWETDAQTLGPLQFWFGIKGGVPLTLGVENVLIQESTEERGRIFYDVPGQHTFSDSHDYLVGPTITVGFR